jgi:succinate dehydrogenase / fumarate reductase, membrane anchor subunit
MAEITLPERLSEASSPKSGENIWLWLWKLASGPFIFILILVHFVVNHYIGETGLLTYNEVLSYYQNWIVPVMEGIFLFLVVSHALLGLRSIILDMRPSRGVLNIVNWLFMVIGVVAVVYGVWLLNAIVASIPRT